MRKRIGVFICHCGVNISGTVAVKKVVEAIKHYQGVIHAEDYRYMCSEPGQELIKKAIKEKNLDAVVIAACSPTMHEATFRNVLAEERMNPYVLEIANIREQCSWVHVDKEKATKKAIKLLRSAIEKVRRDEPLHPIKIQVHRKCLVIGGGISGIRAALDIGDAGFDVILVEKNPSIGGHMAQLSETFPTLDCSQCILTPMMVSVARHPKIKLMAYSEVKEISGYIGNFKVKILKKPRYVKEDVCNICGDCENVCPQVWPDEFNEGMSPRKAIYIPFPQAVPSTYTIDAEKCLGINPLRCDKCMKACEAGAVDFTMMPEIVEDYVGAIIVATGYDIYPLEKIAEYGYGMYADVIDSMQLERMLSASGPTAGVVVRPSDGKTPKTVVFIQCCGSRDPENHKPYCSKICCMYTAKHALLFKHRHPDGEAYVFYIDIRAGGKNYEEFVSRVMEEEKVIYLRGKVSSIYREGNKLLVNGVDTLTGKKIEIKADLVVLAMAMEPSQGTHEIANMLKVSVDQNGFMTEAHPKLRPVETLVGGVFLAGTVNGPRDIPDSVAQGSAAASKAISIISAEWLEHEPQIAFADTLLCSGCGICINLCPYGALNIDPNLGIVTVNEVLCEGCGTCASACPSGAMQMRNSTDIQVKNMIKTILKEGT